MLTDEVRSRGNKGNVIWQLPFADENVPGLLHKSKQKDQNMLNTTADSYSTHTVQKHSASSARTSTNCLMVSCASCKDGVCIPCIALSHFYGLHADILADTYIVIR